ncbi:hypothetical protein F7725_001524 [Dissostichus mawsoni]|uniref:Uncharacterized protein n=1 Tax=Dissostichus mawsoni TaxID=36200 RepID=A0A7J5XZU5_DISMA|nr:hypothetical protein F7725_001524 [Dissostichus mawsoni]
MKGKVTAANGGATGTPFPTGFHCSSPKKVGGSHRRRSHRAARVQGESREVFAVSGQTPRSVMAAGSGPGAAGGRDGEDLRQQLYAATLSKFTLYRCSKRLSVLKEAVEEEKSRRTRFVSQCGLKASVTLISSGLSASDCTEQGGGTVRHLTFRVKGHVQGAVGQGEPSVRHKLLFTILVHSEEVNCGRSEDTGNNELSTVLSNV